MQIYQDGIGFPYLSPICYYYLIGSEDMAISHISVDLEDLPRDSAALVNQIILILASTCIYTSRRKN